MPAPPDDDPVDDWPEDERPTTVDLLPDDLAELEREETTPTVTTEVLPGYDVGRRAGIYETIVDVRALFAANEKNTPEFVETLAVLLARRARVPWPPRTT